jgi:tRNA pseudouridine38-40 synthase
MALRTLRLLIEYDGTNHSGWQVQPGRRTVQDELERAIERILHHPVRLVAAGRTDAGVHASGQVAGFRTGTDMEPARLKKALNGILPRDVTVVEISEAHPDFNARYDARSRTYRYTLSDRRVSIGRNTVWQVKFNLSRELLESATRPLLGPCNLRGFSKGADDEDFSTVIFKNQWMFEGNLMIFEIAAIRFFHHSVRGIVGSAVEVARGKESPDLLHRMLESGDRALAGPTAPPQGLCLVSVDYGEDDR